MSNVLTSSTFKSGLYFLSEAFNGEYQFIVIKLLALEISFYNFVTEQNINENRHDLLNVTMQMQERFFAIHVVEQSPKFNVASVNMSIGSISFFVPPSNLHLVYLGFNSHVITLKVGILQKSFCCLLQNEKMGNKAENDE